MGSVRHAVTAGGHCRCGSERLFVVPGITASAWINEAPLFPEQLAYLVAMESEDLIPEVVDQFEHGERHLRLPEAGDLDGNRTQVCGRFL